MATITIDGPVGLRNNTQQVTNFERDQKKIAALLGKIPAAQGGQKESWAALPPLLGRDRNCTRQLANAILVFQSYWKVMGVLQVADGVVEPGRSSLQKMNELADGTAPVPGAKAFVHCIYNLIPRAIIRQQSAVAVLGWARIAIDFPTTNDFNKAALKLVNRCFKIFEARGVVDWKGDIDTVIRVYQSGIQMLTEAGRKKAYIHEVASHKDNAYCLAGHWSLRTPADGIWFAKDKCTGQSDNWLLDLLTHECSHFCGPMPPGDVGDAAGGYGNGALALPRAKALKNAANHAWFAGLSQTPPSNWPNGTYPS